MYPLAIQFKMAAYLLGCMMLLLFISPGVAVAVFGNEDALPTKPVYEQGFGETAPLDEALPFHHEGASEDDHYGWAGQPVHEYDMESNSHEARHDVNGESSLAGSSVQQSSGLRWCKVRGRNYSAAHTFVLRARRSCPKHRYMTAKCTGPHSFDYCCGIDCVPSSAASTDVRRQPATPSDGSAITTDTEMSARVPSSSESPVQTTLTTLLDAVVVPVPVPEAQIAITSMDSEDANQMSHMRPFDQLVVARIVVYTRRNVAAVLKQGHRAMVPVSAAGNATDEGSELDGGDVAILTNGCGDTRLTMTSNGSLSLVATKADGSWSRLWGTAALTSCDGLDSCSTRATLGITAFQTTGRFGLMLEATRTFAPEANGELVTESFRRPLWRGTRAPDFLALTNDGNLVLVQKTGVLLWHTGTTVSGRTAEQQALCMRDRVYYAIRTCTTTVSPTGKPFDACTAITVLNSTAAPTAIPGYTWTHTATRTWTRSHTTVPATTTATEFATPTTTDLESTTTELVPTSTNEDDSETLCICGCLIICEEPTATSQPPITRTDVNPPVQTTTGPTNLTLTSVTTTATSTSDPSRSQSSPPVVVPPFPPRFPTLPATTTTTTSAPPMPTGPPQPLGPPTPPFFPTFTTTERETTYTVTNSMGHTGGPPRPPTAITFPPPSSSSSDSGTTIIASPSPSEAVPPPSDLPPETTTATTSLPPTVPTPWFPPLPPPHPAPSPSESILVSPPPNAPPNPIPVPFPFPPPFPPVVTITTSIETAEPSPMESAHIFTDIPATTGDQSTATTSNVVFPGVPIINNAHSDGVTADFGELTTITSDAPSLLPVDYSFPTTTTSTPTEPSEVSSPVVAPVGPPMPFDRFFG